MKNPDRSIEPREAYPVVDLSHEATWSITVNTAYRKVRRQSGPRQSALKDVYQGRLE